LQTLVDLAALGVKFGGRRDMASVATASFKASLRVGLSLRVAGHSALVWCTVE
jgi:hypothetical protein